MNWILLYFDQGDTMSELNENTKKIYKYLCDHANSYPSKSLPAICFVSENREGIIRFWPEGIIELTIFDALKDENVFWLHFDASDKKTVDESLKSFFEVLANGETSSKVSHVFNPGSQPLKGAVCCTTGMSSQLFAGVMEDTLQELGINAQFTGWALKDLLNTDEDFTWILLAPQVGYAYNKVKEKFGDKVMNISPLSFGTLDVTKVINDLPPVA